MRNPARGLWPLLSLASSIESERCQNIDVILSILLVKMFLTDSICISLFGFVRTQRTNTFVIGVRSSREDHTPSQRFTVSSLMLAIIQTPSRKSVCAICAAGNLHQIASIFVGPIWPQGMSAPQRVPVMERDGVPALLRHRFPLLVKLLLFQPALQ